MAFRIDACILQDGKPMHTVEDVTSLTDVEAGFKQWVHSLGGDLEEFKVIAMFFHVTINGVAEKYHWNPVIRPENHLPKGTKVQIHELYKESVQDAEVTWVSPTGKNIEIKTAGGTRYRYYLSSRCRYEKVANERFYLSIIEEESL